MAAPFLTVVTPNHNHGHYLKERIPSILDQLPSDGEYLFIDDASTDDSLEIAREFAAKDTRMRILVHEQNQGLTVTSNEGIHEARGRYITFLCSDDIILPGFIEKSMAALKRFPDAPFSCMHYTIMRENGELSVFPMLKKVKEPVHLSSQDYVSAVRQGFSVASASAVTKRELLVKYKGFREEIGPISDHFLYSVIGLEGGVVYIPESLAIWRQTGANYFLSMAARKEEFDRHFLEAARGYPHLAASFRKSQLFNQISLSLLARYFPSSIPGVLLHRSKRNLKRRFARHFRSLKKLPKKLGLAPRLQSLRSTPQEK